jgi:hypothetical protein
LTSVRIASLFSLFSFAILFGSAKRIFPDSGVPYPGVSTFGFAIFAIARDALPSLEPGAALSNREIAELDTLILKADNEAEALARRAIMAIGVALACRYCCKSPKLPGANFPAVKKSDPRPPDRCGLNHLIEVASEFIFRR